MEAFCKLNLKLQSALFKCRSLGRRQVCGYDGHDGVQLGRKCTILGNK